MLWLIILILVIVIFGLGTILEAAFWTLAIIALVVLIAGLALRGAVVR